MESIEVNMRRGIILLVAMIGAILLTMHRTTKAISYCTRRMSDLIPVKSGKRKRGSPRIPSVELIKRGHDYPKVNIGYDSEVQIELTGGNGST